MPETSPTIDAHIACWHVLIGEKMQEIKCEQVATLQGGKWDKMHDIAKRVYGVNGVAPTLHTCGGGNLEPKIMEENRFFKQAFETLNENDCKVGDTVDAFNKKVNDSGVSPTVTTRPEGFKTAILVVDEPIIYDDFNGRIKADQSAVGCLTTNCGNDAPRNGVKIVETPFRVRKLTERECGKLQGVKPKDCNKIATHLSKSAQYHCFGDSITTTVLMAIFGQMLDIDWKQKVNETVKEIIK